MKVVEVHEYKFPTHLLPALVNNEPVIDEDKYYLNTFLDRLEKYKKEYNATDYVVSYELDSYFSYNNCLYGNLGCDVVDIRVHFIR